MTEYLIYLDQLASLKRRIRRYEPESLILTVAARMVSIDKKIVEQRRTPLHNLYHMIKLCILLDERPPRQRTKFQYKDILSLMKCYNELKFPQYEYAKIRNIPKAIQFKWIFQWCQAPFQEIIDSDAMGRTLYLFETNQYGEKLCKLFESESGLTMSEYYQGCMLIYSIASSGLPFCRGNVSNSKLDVARGEKLEALLLLLKSNFKEFRARVEESDLRSDLFEQFSPPVIEKKPIVQLDVDKFVTPWPHFFVNRICFGPYHILKRKYGEKFTSLFGKRFQVYVETLLSKLYSEGSPAFLPERKINFLGKKPDFVIVCNSEALLIECKAIEEATPYIDKDRLKIVEGKKLGEAVVQCFEFGEKLLSNEIVSITEPVKKCYCLVVTYRRFFFANGPFYRSEVILEYPKHLLGNGGFKKFVDEYQIVDIKGFERLVAISMWSGKHLVDIIKQKIRDDLTSEFDLYLVTDQNSEYLRKGIPDIGDKFRRSAEEIKRSIIPPS